LRKVAIIRPSYYEIGKNIVEMKNLNLLGRSSYEEKTCIGWLNPWNHVLGFQNMVSKCNIHFWKLNLREICIFIDKPWFLIFTFVKNKDLFSLDINMNNSHVFHLENYKHF